MGKATLEDYDIGVNSVALLDPAGGFSGGARLRGMSKLTKVIPKYVSKQEGRKMELIAQNLS